MSRSVHSENANLAAPVVSDARFMANVRDALLNGYDECCAACGVGVARDDMDIHESSCPVAEREAE